MCELSVILVIERSTMLKVHKSAVSDFKMLINAMSKKKMRKSMRLVRVCKLIKRERLNVCLRLRDSAFLKVRSSIELSANNASVVKCK